MKDTYTFAHALGQVNGFCYEVTKKSTFLRPFGALNRAFGKLQWVNRLYKDYILSKDIAVIKQSNVRYLHIFPCIAPSQLVLI